MSAARTTDAEPAAARGLDATAVSRIVQRLARAPEPPWLHREVARRMAERLSLIRLQPELVIEWSSWLGGGDDLLREAYPRARRLVVEPHSALLRRSLSQARAPWWSPQRWQARAPEVLDPDAALPQDAQLVWANMLLHGVVDPPALFERWHAALRPDGFVMFSCLGPGTLQSLRTLYERLGWGAPTPAFVDMHDLGDMLVHAGFADPVMDQETITLSWHDADALIAELRALGGNASPVRRAGLRTPRWKEQLRRGLASLAGPDGRPALQFEVAYGHAFRGAPRARPGQPTRVTLDEMRQLVRGKGSKPVR